MNCEHCKEKFKPRGKGSPQRFCNERCRRAFDAKARRAGAQRLRKNGGKKAPKPRLSLIEKMEAEAIAAGTPGMFAHPGSRPAIDPRLELGKAALRLGLLTPHPSLLTPYA